MRRVILLIISLCIIFIGIIYLIQTVSRILKQKPPGPIKQEVKIRVEDNILHFYKETFWSENDFVKLSKFKNEFVLSEINSFKNNLKDHERYITNLRLNFDESRKATILSCDVKGIEVAGKYDFDWFLKPLSLTLPPINLEPIDLGKTEKIPLLKDNR